MEKRKLSKRNQTAVFKEILAFTYLLAGFVSITFYYYTIIQVCPNIFVFFNETLIIVMCFIAYIIINHVLLRKVLSEKTLYVFESLLFISLVIIPLSKLCTIYLEKQVLYGVLSQRLDNIFVWLLAVTFLLLSTFVLILVYERIMARSISDKRSMVSIKRIVKQKPGRFWLCLSIVFISVILTTKALTILNNYLEEPTADLCGGYLFFEDKRMIYNPNKGIMDGIPPHIESYWEFSPFIVAKQRPIIYFNDSIHHDIEYNYYLGFDTVYYWVIDTEKHKRYGPMEYEAIWIEGDSMAIPLYLKNLIKD